MRPRRRIDVELVRRGLSETRAEAASLVAEGRVLVNGAPTDKVSRQVDPADSVVVTGPTPRFVGRGGEKLDAALAWFGIDVDGRVVLDAGASTGGFTDCVLQRGASRVAAVDVGHGQLHPRLRADDRVAVFEHTNVRDLAADDIGGPVDLVVADLSFISLTVVAATLLEVARPGADLVLLVKPQFEIGRDHDGRKVLSRGRGVVTDPIWQARACDRVVEAVGRRRVRGIVESPLRGGDGNKEFLLHAVADARLTS